MEKFIIAGIFLSFMYMSASQEFKRDLHAYKFHHEELRRVWIKDRFVRPVRCAACIAATAMALVTYVLFKLEASGERSMDLLILGGITGLALFVPSLVSCLSLQWLFRLIKANSEEEGLKQTLALIALRLKTAIAEGRVGLEDLALCCSEIRCPITEDLMRYACWLRTLE
jgi:hypothetical protein